MNYRILGRTGIRVSEIGIGIGIGGEASIEQIKSSASYSNSSDLERDYSTIIASAPKLHFMDIACIVGIVRHALRKLILRQ